jgi:hypothetical protein
MILFFTYKLDGQVKKPEARTGLDITLTPCPPCACINYGSTYARRRCFNKCPFHQWLKKTMEEN